MYLFYPKQRRFLLERTYQPVLSTPASSWEDTSSHNRDHARAAMKQLPEFLEDSRAIFAKDVGPAAASPHGAHSTHAEPRKVPGCVPVGTPLVAHLRRERRALHCKHSGCRRPMALYKTQIGVSPALPFGAQFWTCPEHPVASCRLAGAPGGHVPASTHAAVNASVRVPVFAQIPSIAQNSLVDAMGSNAKEFLTGLQAIVTWGRTQKKANNEEDEEDEEDSDERPATPSEARTNRNLIVEHRAVQRLTQLCRQPTENAAKGNAGVCWYDRWQNKSVEERQRQADVRTSVSSVRFQPTIPPPNKQGRVGKMPLSSALAEIATIKVDSIWDAWCLWGRCCKDTVDWRASPWPIIACRLALLLGAMGACGWWGADAWQDRAWQANLAVVALGVVLATGLLASLWFLLASPAKNHSPCKGRCGRHGCTFVGAQEAALARHVHKGPRETQAKSSGGCGDLSFCAMLGATARCAHRILIVAFFLPNFVRRVATLLAACCLLSADTLVILSKGFFVGFTYLATVVWLFLLVFWQFPSTALALMLCGLLCLTGPLLPVFVLDGLFFVLVGTNAILDAAVLVLRHGVFSGSQLAATIAQRQRRSGAAGNPDIIQLPRSLPFQNALLFLLPLVVSYSSTFDGYKDLADMETGSYLGERAHANVTQCDNVNTRHYHLDVGGTPEVGMFSFGREQPDWTGGARAYSHADGTRITMIVDSSTGQELPYDLNPTQAFIPGRESLRIMCAHTRIRHSTVSFACSIPLCCAHYVVQTVTSTCSVLLCC